MGKGIERFARVLLGLTFIASVGGFSSGQETREVQGGAGRPRVVVLTQSKGFVHGVVKRGAEGQLSVVEKTFEELARKAGTYDVECTQDVTVLTPEKLKETRVVVLYTTGDLPFPPGGLEAFERWVKGGGSVLGVHTATDTFLKTPLFYNMIGGTFDGHPWTSNTTVTIELLDEANPAVKAYADRRTFKEEIYQHRNFAPENVRVLMGLDMGRTELKRPFFVPIAWCRRYGEGKVFYTSLGHREDTWGSAEFREHIAVAMDWLLGRVEMEARPNPEVSAREDEEAKRAVAATQPEKQR